MKGNRTYMDIGSILDEVFEAAKDFGEQVGKNFADQQAGSDGPCGSPPGCGPRDGAAADDDRLHIHHSWYENSHDESPDYYPNYCYPPMNIYLTPERSLVFEFALAGFEEKDISLTFQGDYMVFAAAMGMGQLPEEGSRYIKRRLKLKDVDKQKYYVPADKFAQDKVKAVFHNGVLKVTVPPKDEAEEDSGIKIEIKKEGE